jgi:hypothetical protein
MTHVAGLQAQIGTRVRQRCAWCGVLLIDHDLQRIAAAGGQAERPPMWEVGGLVRADGNLYVALDHEEGSDVPADSCARLDDAVTV